MDVRVGLWRKLSAEELMLLNCGVGEDSRESLGLQGDPTSPFQRRSVQPWDFFGGNDAKAEAPVLWPPHAKSWLIGNEGMGAGGEGDDRGWDGWMASLTQWTWVWVNSGTWWRTGRPGVLWFMGSQRVGHNWATELNWSSPPPTPYKVPFIGHTWLSTRLKFNPHLQDIFPWKKTNSQVLRVRTGMFRKLPTPPPLTLSCFPCTPRPQSISTRDSYSGQRAQLRGFRSEPRSSKLHVDLGDTMV